MNLSECVLPTWIENPHGDYWLSDNYLVLDFETRWEGYEDIILACWKTKNNTVKARWGGKYEQQLLLEAIKKADFIVAHFTKFELKWLAECGLPLEDVLAWCTQIGEYVRLGNRKEELSLDEVARRYGFGGKENLVSMMIKNEVCPSRIPPSLLLRYCVKDVNLAEQVFLKQREILRRDGQLGTMLSRCVITPVLVEIEANGLCAVEPAQKAAMALQETLTEASVELTRITGGINHDSPKQVGAYLYDTLKFEELKDKDGKPLRTKKDGRKTGTDVIQSLEAITEEQKEFKKAISQIILVQDEFDFIDKLNKAQTELKGIIKAVINQTVSQTHRFTSNGRAPYNIQFQNIANDRKHYFGPRFGDEWEMFEADQSQLEFRAIVHYGRDEQGRRDIWDGFDVHIFSAESNGLYLPNGKPDRKAGKIFTFRPIYYGGRGSKWFKAFRGRWPGIGKVQDTWLNTVLKTKQLQIETGLKFYWPDCKMKQDGYIVPATQICNYPVQSICGADIVPVALMYTWHYAKRLMPKKDWLIVNTVHDQGLFEIKKYLRELFTDIVVQCNSTKVYEWIYKVYGVEFFAPLGVGLKAGPRWSKGDEIEIDVNTDGELRVRKNKDLDSFKGRKKA